jgi:Fe-S oxidoreductase
VSCCGRPLFEAGYREMFATHVREVWRSLGEREVVTLSAACGKALTDWAREVGVEPRGPVVHATTYLARRLGPDVQAPPLRLSATYHDPCHLGRGCGEYDSPRRLLGAALEGEIVEPPTTRETSDCCGASGLLPRTFPEVARAMAMTRADELRSAGTDVVVTACPACRSSLQGAGLEVRDVVEVVAEWLTGQSGPAGN